MKHGKFVIVLFLVLVFSLFAFADTNSLQTTEDISTQDDSLTQQTYENPQQYNTQPQNGQVQQPYNTQPQNSQSQQSSNNQSKDGQPQQANYTQGMVMQPQFNFGMTQSSNADPEYVAQQKMVEGMTTAYNWISLNSTRFSSGCKTSKDDLIKEIASVVSSSQEASSVCEQFSEESKDCNPETYCALMSSGKIPLPPQTRTTMKKLGYDPDTMKVQDITKDLIVKVCIEQTNTELNNRVEMIAATKKSISDQLSSFRANCEEYKKNKNMGPNIQLPTFNFPKREYAPGTGPNQQVQQQNQYPQQGQPNQPQGQQYPPQGNGPNGQPQNFCNGSGPICQAGQAPFCQNGNWVCQRNGQPQPIIQNPSETESDGSTQEQNETTTDSTSDESSTTTDTTSDESSTTTDTTSDGSLTTTDATTGTDDSTTGEEIVETMKQAIYNNPITGLFGAMFAANQSVCGNGICEVGIGEDPKNCPSDCMEKQFNQEQNYNNQPQGQNQPNQSRGMGSSMSPEQLCTMTDDEIIAEYMGNTESDLTFEKERNALRCKEESTKILSEMNRYNLESAKCKANAALDCEAKRQAFSTCSEMQDSPEKISTMIVNNMCRRFITSDEAKNNKLLDLATMFDQQDPALANQLGDTAEKNLADQKNLNFTSYLFGDGGYAQKLKERTDKLKEARDRLAATSSTDNQEVLNLLDTQIADLESESAKFANIFDVTRLGYMFGR